MRPKRSFTWHHGIDHVTLGHVHHEADGGGAFGLALLDRLVHRRLLHVADDHGGAFTRELECGGHADALCGAGDDADLAFESFHADGVLTVAKKPAGCGVRRLLGKV
jgi:hypothetical protein